MRYEKQIIDRIEVCYALTKLVKDGRDVLVAAAEKRAPCRLYELDGACIGQIWDSPGGIMTMVPVPGGNGTFLSTQAFFSPDESTEARIVCAKEREDGWTLTKVRDIPHIHRFDIIPKHGINYVIACTLKSGHEYPSDWRSPGRIWTGVLPDDPEHPLELTVFQDGLTRNHGYTRYERDGEISCVISCDEGVFLVSPPEEPDQPWRMERLLDSPASDAVLIDLDGDGQAELLTLSPFHGDTLAIWHRGPNGYQKVYEHPEKLPFLHAITAGTVYGRPVVFVGHRGGAMRLLGFWYDRARGTYCTDVLDEHAGTANCMLFERSGHPALLAANRELDQVAIYDIYPDGAETGADWTGVEEDAGKTETGRI